MCCVYRPAIFGITVSVSRAADNASLHFPKIHRRFSAGRLLQPGKEPVLSKSVSGLAVKKSVEALKGLKSNFYLFASVMMMRRG